MISEIMLRFGVRYTQTMITDGEQRIVRRSTVCKLLTDSPLWTETHQQRTLPCLLEASLLEKKGSFISADFCDRS